MFVETSDSEYRVCFPSANGVDIIAIKTITEYFVAIFAIDCPLITVRILIRNICVIFVYINKRFQIMSVFNFKLPHLKKRHALNRTPI